MKTYNDNGFRYYYDTSLKMWTIYKVDEIGDQLGTADYHYNKSRLLLNHPELTFTPEKSIKK